jgi:glycosyltransferase involved in cell wall biosynthesis
LGFGDSFLLYERGMPVADLWRMYAASDVFLITPKAEGAGLPILEAMAVGLPVLGTDCCAVKEHLSDGRGFLIPWEFKYIDPFMNGNRYFASRELGAQILGSVYDKIQCGDEMIVSVRNAALKYVESRRWSGTASKFEEVLNKIEGEKNVETKPS